MDNADSQLNLGEEHIVASREALSSLKEQEEKNSVRGTQALDWADLLQKNLEENRGKIGPTMPEIEKQLSNIESEFSQFVTLNSTGDPMEASVDLVRAEERTSALGQISGQIPAIFAKLDDDCTERFDDWDHGYTHLLEAIYHVPDSDIEARFRVDRCDVPANSF